MILLRNSIFKFYDNIAKATEVGVNVEEYIKLPYVSRIGKVKFVEESIADKEFDDIERAMVTETDEIMSKGGLV